jgi:hypothetical protein
VVYGIYAEFFLSGPLSRDAVAFPICSIRATSFRIFSASFAGSTFFFFMTASLSVHNGLGETKLPAIRLEGKPYRSIH